MKQLNSRNVKRQSKEKFIFMASKQKTKHEFNLKKRLLYYIYKYKQFK